MNPLMMLMMLAGGHALMNDSGRHRVVVPTAVMDVRYAKCPIKGGIPNDELAVLYRNRVYRFCSLDCRKTFNRKPRRIVRRVASSPRTALRTTNPGGFDPVSGHPINLRRNPPFLVREQTITFYASQDTVGKDNPSQPTTIRREKTREHAGPHQENSSSDDHSGHGMGCH